MEGLKTLLLAVITMIAIILIYKTLGFGAAALYVIALIAIRSGLY